VVLASKPLEGFGGFGLKTIGGVWWFLPQNHWRSLVVSASKLSDDSSLVWASKPGVDGLVVWALKPSTVGLTGLGLKTGE
jgi:hypothetical protein